MNNNTSDNYSDNNKSIPISEDFRRNLLYAIAATEFLRITTNPQPDIPPEVIAAMIIGVFRIRAVLVDGENNVELRIRASLCPETIEELVE